MTDRPIVGCDKDCGAFQQPATTKEFVDALNHWMHHGYLSGAAMVADDELLALAEKAKSLSYPNLLFNALGLDGVKQLIQEKREHRISAINLNARLVMAEATITSMEARLAEAERVMVGAAKAINHGSKHYAVRLMQDFLAGGEVIDVSDADDPVEAAFDAIESRIKDALAGGEEDE